MGSRAFDFGRFLGASWNYPLARMQSAADIFGDPRLHRTPSPVMAVTILMWISIFRPGRTIAQYIARVVDVAIFLRRPTDWLTPDVKSLDLGIRICQELPFEFQNYVMADYLLLTLHAGNMSTEFGHAAFFSFLSPCGCHLEHFGCAGRMILHALRNPHALNTSFWRAVRRVNGSGLFIAKFHRWGI